MYKTINYIFFGFEISQTWASNLKYTGFAAEIDAYDMLQYPQSFYKVYKLQSIVYLTLITVSATTATATFTFAHFDNFKSQNSRYQPQYDEQLNIVIANSSRRKCARDVRLRAQCRMLNDTNIS